MNRKNALICSAFIFALIYACSPKTTPPVKPEANTSYDGPMVSYAGNIEPMLSEKCTPCHYPSKGGYKKALNSYETVKRAYSDIIRRVQLPEDHEDFMPYRQKREPLTEEELELLKNWEQGGYPE